MRDGELPIPPQAVKSGPSFELVRVWVADGDQHVSVATNVWEDPAAWGIMMVDLARHVANAYARTHGMRQLDVLERIKEGFDAEWREPTDEPSGGI